MLRSAHVPNAVRGAVECPARRHAESLAGHEESTAGGRRAEGGTCCPAYAYAYAYALCTECFRGGQLQSANAPSASWCTAALAAHQHQHHQFATQKARRQTGRLRESYAYAYAYAPWPRGHDVMIAIHRLSASAGRATSDARTRLGHSLSAHAHTKLRTRTFSLLTRVVTGQVLLCVSQLFKLPSAAQADVREAMWCGAEGMNECSPRARKVNVARGHVVRSDTVTVPIPGSTTHARTHARCRIDNRGAQCALCYLRTREFVTDRYICGDGTGRCGRCIPPPVTRVLTPCAGTGTGRRGQGRLGRRLVRH